MKCKICAILLVLGMILCQIPQTAAAAENTVPGSEEVTFGAKAESDTSVTPLLVEEVSLVVSQPSIGETTDTEAPDVTASDWKYEVTDASWVDSEGIALSTPLTFESDATYYIAATVKSYWESDATYYFPQINIPVNIENGSVVGMPAITNVYNAGSTMQVLIAVQPVVRRSGDQIQVWAGSIDGNTTMADSGGKVATNYTPSEPNIYDFGKDGTFSAGDIVQFYTGDEITVVAQADEGYRFAGWYRVNIDYNMSGGDTDHNGETPNKAYMGSAFSTVSSFTYKPGETILSGDTEPLRYVCAVFAEGAAETFTVSFDPGTGTGSVDPVTVDAGTEYELPSCTFTHANTQRTFYAWSVDDELKKPGDTITVSKDTVVIAKWLDTSRAQRIDNSVDKSTTEVVCTLRLKDTRTGEVAEESVYKKTTASGFTEPSNSTVKAMIREAGESAAARAREIAGHDVTIVSEGVSDLEILETSDNRTHTHFTGTDDAGDYAGYIIIDGEWWHLWRYIVTVEAEYTSSAAAISIEKASVGGVSLSYGYSGKAYVPKLTVKVNGKTLVKDTDYTVVYADNKNPGTATITITGIGNYTGTRIKTFEIVDCVSSLVSGKTYQIIPKNNSATAVCSFAGRMVNNTKVYITDRSASEAMRFKAVKNSDGTWKFINAKCEMSLAVQQNSSEVGKGLVLYDQTTRKAQNWKLTRKSDNSFAITNAVSGLYVSMSDMSAPKGTLLTMHEDSGRADQRFYIVETNAVDASFDGTYSVRASKNESYALNVSSSSTADGANVNLYKFSDTNAMKFKAIHSGAGYYRLVNVNSGLVLSVKGNTKRDGTNVIQSKWAAQSGQKWSITKSSNGTVTLTNALGTVLHLNGNKTVNGRNVIAKNASTTGAQKWYLE